MGPMQTYYINYVLDSKEVSAFSQCFQVKQRMQDNIAYRIFSEKVKALFNGSDTDIERYFALINKMVTSQEFESAVSTMDASISTGEYAPGQYFSGEIINKLTEDASELARVLSGLQDAISYIIAAIEGNAENIQKMQVNDKIKARALQIFHSEDFAISSSQYQNLSNAFKGQYRGLIAKLSSMQDIDITSLTTADPNFSSILASLTARTNRLVGIISEFIIAAQFEDIVVDLEKSLNGIPNITASLTRTGDEGSKAFRIGTKDLSIDITEKGGIASMQWPSAGISLKRTKIKDSGVANKEIHLKSSNVGAMLNAIQGNIMTQYRINAFYNLYADYKRPWGGKKPQPEADESDNIDQATMQSMYGILHLAFVSAALAGSMTEEDFSFVFVVNNKKYSIVDMLKNLTAEDINSNTGAIVFKGKNLQKMQPTIAKTHITNSYIRKPSEEQQLKRSNKTISAINRISINMSLKMNLNNNLIK